MNLSASLFSLHSGGHHIEPRKLHLKLNQAYYALLFGAEGNTYALEDQWQEFKRLEAQWFSQDKLECIKKYPCDKPVKNIYFVELALRDHPVLNHAIFDYFCYEADLHDLKKFILSEAILNFEFFDYLTLALIGASSQAKAEIMSNLWDEAGRGNLQKFHTTLFGNLLRDLGLKYQRTELLKALSWEALAGINLFSYCSIYPAHKMIYFGLLAATEMLDPTHYRKLIQGMERVFSGYAVDYSYYLEHEVIDIEHANGWLRKVILPELEKEPHRAQDFWLGFYLRLDSAKRYYDRLLECLTQKKSA